MPHDLIARRQDAPPHLPLPFLSCLAPDTPTRRLHSHRPRS
uniref:Uncharacterized protein n=1 Tax=Tetraselmis sp. GSL018 TaxID=582737 RepID=A0A061RJB0_9CHLO